MESTMTKLVPDVEEEEAVDSGGGGGVSETTTSPTPPTQSSSVGIQLPHWHIPQPSTPLTFPITGLKMYNSLTRHKELFIPMNGTKQITWYMYVSSKYNYIYLSLSIYIYIYMFI